MSLEAGQEATATNGHGTTDWFQIGKGVCQDCILLPWLFNLYADISCKMPGWMKNKLDSRLPREISMTSDMQMTPPLWQKAKKNQRASWWKWKRKVGKVGLKLNIQKTKIMASGPITSWQIDGETMGTVRDFIFWGDKITADGYCSHEIKRWFFLCRKVMTNLDSILKNRDITLPTKVRLAKAIVFSSGHVWMLVRLKRKLSTKELTFLNCGAGEDSWGSLGWQGDQTSQS